MSGKTSTDSNLESFFDSPPAWGTEIQIERRNRIRLSMAAFAYEENHDLVMEDYEFDQLALKIRPEMNTTDDVTDPEQKKRYERLDRFFREQFQPDTGQWIYFHPEIESVKKTYFKYYRKKN